jgi:hypothetical protein
VERTPIVRNLIVSSKGLRIMNHFQNRTTGRKQLLLVVAMLVVSLVVTAMPAKSQAEEFRSIYLPAIQGGSLQPSSPESPETEQPLTVDDSTPPSGQASDSDILWSADFEQGSYPGGISISGIAWPALSTERVHSGQYAASLTIVNADGNQNPEPGVRLTYHAHDTASPSDPKNLPDEAYYSAHYFFPTQVMAEWWNLMQWKQSTMTSSSSQTRIPVYFVSSVYINDAMHFVLRSKVSAEGEYTQPGSTLAVATLPVPIESWVRLECLYHWSKEATGRIACWQNGELLWDVNNIITEFDIPYLEYPRQWTVNSYAGRTYPTSHTIYVDDFAVRTTPLGAE